MVLLTASAVVDFLTKLEEASSVFYENLSQAYPERKEIFESYARENKKNSSSIKRVYQEVITDALDGGFSFRMNEEEYLFDKRTEDLDYKRAVEKAIEMEKRVEAAYSDAAETSRSLMSDLTRLFDRIAKGKRRRIAELEELNKVKEEKT